MGKPLVHSAEIKIRVGSALKAKAMAKCQQRGLTLSDYLRWALEQLETAAANEVLKSIKKGLEEKE